MIQFIENSNKLTLIASYNAANIIILLMAIEKWNSSKLFFLELL
ncbi:MAG: hypothetical protein ACTS73_08860 [Arsenophonus sp. NEOnobi-MAG3]